MPTLKFGKISEPETDAARQPRPFRTFLSGSIGNVNPKGNATRAEAAKMVVVLHDLLA